MKHVHIITFDTTFQIQNKQNLGFVRVVEREGVKGLQLHKNSKFSLETTKINVVFIVDFIFFTFIEY